MSATPPRLGKIQLQIMQILWERGEATARQITEDLTHMDCTVAHSTVQTLLRKMEAKGAVTHDASERTWVFRPLCQENEVNRSVAHDLLTRVFGGSVYGLVAHLFRHESIPQDELQRLRTLLEESERRSKQKNPRAEGDEPQP